MKTVRKIIFWSHLLAGCIAGVVIFIMSATGVILMYEHQLVEYAERDVRQVVPPGSDAQRLSLDEIVAKAREQNAKAKPTAVVLRNEPTASVSVSFGRDGAAYVNPYTGAVLGSGSKLHDWFHEVIDWHRWLGTEGEGRATARAITGACNLAFFWLAVTGVYLWWPRSWHWRGVKHSFLFNSRLGGKARDWNWHNVIGFWSSSVLVVLTLTAAVMSYPWANDLLYTLTGSEPPRRSEGPAGSVAQEARARDQRGEARAAATATSVDVLLTRAHEQVPGWVMIMLRFQPRGDGPVTASIQGPDAFHPFQRSQLTLNRASGDIVKWEPYVNNSTGRKLRTWVRALHTGEAFGFVGQTIAGLASLGGCFLVWTGLAMAWRRFNYRKREAEDSVTTRSTTATTERSVSLAQTAPQAIDVIRAQSSTEPQKIEPHGANGNSHLDDDPKAAWYKAPFNSDSALILYGTVTGNAEALANKLAAELRRGGIGAQVRDMADCQSSVLNKANFLLIVTSTYGNGEPPDDAAPFWEAVVYGNGFNLHDVKFSVLALGNTTYDHFCKCGRELDAALERHGATRFYPRVDCDVDYDTPAALWMTGVIDSIRQNH